MKLYRNTNDAYGEPGPFEAKSKRDLALELVDTFEKWAIEELIRHDQDLDEDTIAHMVDNMCKEFISELEEVK